MLRISIATMRRWVPPILSLAVLIAATHGLIPWYLQIPFLLYAVYIFFVLRPHHRDIHAPTQSPDATEDRFFSVLTVFSFCSILLTRLLPFLRFGASPLGYDTGFYWEYFHLIIPAGHIGTSAGSHLTLDPWFPLAALGFNALATIQFLHVFHQLLTASALYLLLHSLFTPRYRRAIACCGVFLFAVSITQFEAYWWMFYKQSFALPFFLLALALFFRRSWLALPVGAFAAAIHLPSAIPFGAGLALYVAASPIIARIRHRPMDRGLWLLILGGIAMVILVALLKGTDDLLYYVNLFRKYRGIAATANAWEVAQLKGLFIPFSVFRVASLYVLPFALVGLLHVRGRIRPTANAAARAMVLVATVAVLLVLVSFPFLHQHRSLILLDVLIIVIAAEPLYRFIRSCLSDRITRVTLAVLLMGMVISIGRVVWAQQPQLYADESRELALLARTGTASDIRTADEYVMATSALYTPWVHAFAGFERTIAPGWLSYNRWNLAMWREFWLGDDNERRIELLRMYGDHAIYIFIGSHVLNTDAPLHTFIREDPHFTQFSPHIWKYAPTPRGEGATPGEPPV